MRAQTTISREAYRLFAGDPAQLLGQTVDELLAEVPDADLITISVDRSRRLLGVDPELERPEHRACRRTD